MEETGKPEGSEGPFTLAVDIGGTGVKVITLDDAGNAVCDRGREETPAPATPTAVLDVIGSLAGRQHAFDRISVGFPGVVREGVTWTAHNLDSAWIGFPLATTLTERLDKPARAANDADVQGLGVITGKGVELALTLGTGLGSALFVDGKIVPNLEIAHHRFRKGKTYEENLGRVAMKFLGKRKWQKRLLQAIEELDHLFNFDALYLGGGNAKKVNVDLPEKATIVPNIAGLLGGIALWRQQ